MRDLLQVHRLEAGHEVHLPADPVDLGSIRDGLVDANVEYAT
ncbi:MAG: hypothetical protein ABIX10_02375 [Acidimicrobiales bacterium]